MKQRWDGSVGEVRQIRTVGHRGGWINYAIWPQHDQTTYRGSPAFTTHNFSNALLATARNRSALKAFPQKNPRRQERWTGSAKLNLRRRFVGGGLRIRQNRSLCTARPSKIKQSVPPPPPMVIAVVIAAEVVVVVVVVVEKFGWWCRSRQTVMSFLQMVEDPRLADLLERERLVSARQRTVVFLRSGSSK